jgi:hypothetical protein
MLPEYNINNVRFVGLDSVPYEGRKFLAVTYLRVDRAAGD